MGEHTPTPWTAEAEYENGNPTYIHKDGHGVADCSMGYGVEDDANAAFIVKAVNAHDALVKALDWAMARIIKKAPHHAHEGDGELYAFAEAHSLLAKLRPVDVGGARE